MTPTANMKMRFIASDEGEGSLVEALVDDFRLLDFQHVDAVPTVPLPTRLELAAPTPNPFTSRTRFAFSLPVAAEVSLRIHDLAGRAVRTLANGRFEAGSHDVMWDGADDTGRVAPSGIYFGRLTAAGGVRVQRVMRLR